MLLSVKLHISDLETKKNKSLIKILRMDPKLNPCGIPLFISTQSLSAESAFLLPR